MLRFYFKLFTLLFFIGIFESSVAQKKLANAPTIRKKNEIKAEYFFIKGEDKFLQKNYDRAISLFIDADKYSPKNAAIQYKLSESHFFLENYDKAILYVKKAIHIDKKILEPYLLLSKIHLNQKNYEDAAKTYENLIENVEGSNKYYAELAHVYQQILVKELQQIGLETNKKKKKHSEKKVYNLSIKSLQAYIELEKNNGYDVKITDQKQKLWLLINKFDKAFEEGEQFLSRYPNHINFILNQSQLLYSNKRQQEAIEYLEKKNKNTKTTQKYN